MRPFFGTGSNVFTTIETAKVLAIVSLDALVFGRIGRARRRRERLNFRAFLLASRGYFDREKQRLRESVTELASAENASGSPFRC